MKKMITITMFLLFSSLFIAGCSGDNIASCMNSVNESFPNSEVINIPNHDCFCFLVRTSSGEIWYVECKDSDPKISAKTKLLNANKMEK